MTIFTATAHTNIALIKYWGKSADAENLPATGSLSLTLDNFFTTTSAGFTNDAKDSFTLNGASCDLRTEQRVFSHIEIFRSLSARNDRLKIQSFNHVPTASGLASSASGFAALTLVLAKVFDLNLSDKALSQVARRGSGSAARSIFGGFARMHGGPDVTHAQAFAETIQSPLLADTRMVVLECAQGQKAIGSREAMKLTSQTSVFYQSFLDNHPKLLDRALDAATHGDFQTLGHCMEQSTLQMHATMLGCDQPFWYFNSTTLLVLEEVKRLRQMGYQCYFTMDAGPHVKVLCSSNDAAFIADACGKVAGVMRSTICRPGPGAYLHGE